MTESRHLDVIANPLTGSGQAKAWQSSGLKKALLDWLDCRVGFASSQ